MNSFHHFKTAVELKEKNKAMLILRDKTESVARKIMEKARIQVPDYKGRFFWQWAQAFIIQACSQREVNHAIPTARQHDAGIVVPPVADTQPWGRRHPEAHRPDGHAGRPCEHHTDAGPTNGVVCPRTSRVPVVHTDMGSPGDPRAGTASDTGQPALDLGSAHTTGVQSGVPGTRSLVCPEHPVRLCGRHAAAVMVPPQRNTWPYTGDGTHHVPDVAADARQLRSTRNDAGVVPGHRVFRLHLSGQTGPRCRGLLFSADAERGHTSAGQYAGRAGFRHHPHAAAAGSGSQYGHRILSGWNLPIYAPELLLRGLCRSPGHSAHPPSVCIAGYRPGQERPELMNILNPASPARPESLQEATDENPKDTH